jgi:hypothetical protein
MLLRKYIRILALVVSFAATGHPAHASPEFEKFKDFLQEVSREAGLYEGDFAAMAQYIPSLPSYPDSSSRPKETLNAGLSEPVEAESAFGKLMYHLARNEAEEIQRLLESATFDPREDPQFDIDRISLQAIPSNAAISAQKSKLIQVICSSFAQFLECANSKKFLHALEHLHKPKSEDSTKQNASPEIESKEQTPTRPYSRSDESADGLSLSRVRPKSAESTTPRARTLSAPAGPHTGKIHLTGSAAALYYATGVSSRLMKGYKTPSFSNSDFYELLKQLGTRASVKETGNGSSKYYEVPSRDFSHGKILPDKTRAFRIHLSHNGSDDLPLHTIRRYLGAHLSLAGLDDAAIDFELPR